MVACATDAPAAPVSEGAKTRDDLATDEDGESSQDSLPGNGAGDDCDGCDGFMQGLYTGSSLTSQPCVECSAVSTYGDVKTGDWWCDAHGPIWTRIAVSGTYNASAS